MSTAIACSIIAVLNTTHVLPVGIQALLEPVAVPAGEHVETDTAVFKTVTPRLPMNLLSMSVSTAAILP